jgi:MFS family permease
LYVRLSLTETPVFAAEAARRTPVRVPMLVVFRDHTRTLVLGMLVAVSTFVLFYLMTVFVVSWGVTSLGYTRETLLIIQLVGSLFFGALIPISAALAGRGRRKTLFWGHAAIAVFGFVMAPLVAMGLGGTMATMLIGMALVGVVYGPLGTVLSELFPTAIRYSGSSLTFNLAGIAGGSLAPYIATWLATGYGLHYVGFYLSLSAVLSLIGIALTRETRDEAL